MDPFSDSSKAESVAFVPVTALTIVDVVPFSFEESEEVPLLSFEESVRIRAFAPETNVTH